MKSVLIALLVTLSGPALADHMFEGRDIERGATLYAETCASCHGENLEGQPAWRDPGPDGILPAPPHSVEGHTWHHDTRMLFDYVKLGGQEALDLRGVTGFTSGMPGFAATLSDDDILDTLAFIRSTWPDEAKAVQASRTHQGG